MKDICDTCGGTGQINYFQGVSRFLLTTEECPECAGLGYCDASQESDDRESEKGKSNEATKSSS